jgi:hypothetical protein
MKGLLVFILILLGTASYAQSPLTNDIDDDIDDNFVDPDSVDYDSYTKKSSSFKALFNGKPGNAILYGMLIPGGGQMYNKKYWKVPIALLAEGAGIYAFVFLRGEYNNFKEAYRLTLLGEGVPYRGISGIDPLNSFRQRYQKWSEQAGVAMIVVHIIVAIEAYIDRHLSIFDIDEDLSFDYSSPGYVPNSRISGVSVRYSF